jgi:hypothetical protein
MNVFLALTKRGKKKSFPANGDLRSRVGRAKHPQSVTHLDASFCPCSPLRGTSLT